MAKQGVLTPKQEAFCNEYWRQKGNASEAYRKAYNVKAETKDKSVWEQASRLMADSKVASRIAEMGKTYQILSEEKTKLTIEWVLKTLKEIAENGQVESARVSALEKIGKHLKMFTDIIENRISPDDIERIAEKLMGVIESEIKDETEKERVINRCADIFESI